MPRMTSVQYEKKVREYLMSHLDNLVIHRLRTNKPITKQDLEALEAMLIRLGEDDGKTSVFRVPLRYQPDGLSDSVR